jgi:hypothetical protein
VHQASGFAVNCPNSDGKGGPGPIAKANWIKIAVEPLPNGDDVAVAVAWKPENPFTKVAQGDLQAVQTMAQGGAFRAESQSRRNRDR